MTSTPALDNVDRASRLPLDRFFSAGFTVEEITRFEDRVDRDGPAPDVAGVSGGCWIWRGWQQSAGYGQFYLRGTSVLAHRAAWAIANGPLPESASYHGTIVIQRCRRRLCVRPDHLEITTAAASLRRRYAEGRMQPPVSRRGPRTDRAGIRRGEDHWRSKLSWEQVEEIRARVAGGESMRSVARSLDIHHSNVSAIVRGRTWQPKGTTE